MKMSSQDKKVVILMAVFAVLLVVFIILLANHTAPKKDDQPNTEEPAATATQLIPMVTPTEKPAETPDEKEEPTPTAAVEPTAAPTATPEQTATATPVPTATATPAPTSTPETTAAVEAKVITHGDPNSKKIAFSINVAWGEENINSILSTLKANNIKTTFFIQGYWADYCNKAGMSQYLQNIYNDGHELGLHGWGHDDPRKLAEQGKLARLLGKNHDMIMSLTGYDCKLYAPPSGYYNDQVLRIAADSGYRTITYSIDSIDWKEETDDVVYERVVNDLTGGSIILVHPTAVFASILPRIIEEANARGYTITTVSDCIEG